MLAFVGQHLEIAAAVALFVLWKGPGWALEVLALEKAWKERRDHRAAQNCGADDEDGQ